jgi:hypothetical protein
MMGEAGDLKGLKDPPQAPCFSRPGFFHISETTCANTCAADERLPSKHRRRPNHAGGEIHGQVRCDP